MEANSRIFPIFGSNNEIFSTFFQLLMDILFLSTYLHGGAAVSARRLQSAIVAAGVQANMLTADLSGSRFPFYAERLSFLPFERDNSVRFSFSLANFGHDLRKHPMVQKADILHLHWVNQGFLSLQNIQQLSELGKPIVWTLHDMWAFTGGCHYSGSCENYKDNCGNCPFLRWPGARDLSNKILTRKRDYFPRNMHFVTSSEWLAKVARTSSLLKSYSVEDIPIPIDTDIFRPQDESKKLTYRQKLGIGSHAQVVLFVAIKVSETRKGFSYLHAALEKIKQAQPERPIEILVMGKSDPADLQALPYPVHALGMLSNTADLVNAYTAADVFVIPSLEDNLPNTVLESLACGTPVAGFQTGGIPEMVGHLSEGYIAPQRDADELAKGILYLIDNQKDKSKNARQKALAAYANPLIAARYISLYQRLLSRV